MGSVKNEIRYHGLILPPIDPDTGSGYEEEGTSEYEEYYDDGLCSEADHNLNA